MTVTADSFEWSSDQQYPLDGPTVWVVTGEDGCMGVFASMALAIDHAESFPVGEFEVEPAPVRNEPMA